MDIAAYNRDGTPFVGTFVDWATMYAAHDRKVAQTNVGRVTISTVFLSLDCSNGTGPPLIFETMVFGSGVFAFTCERYSTEEQALAGHDAIVAKVMQHNALSELNTWVLL